MLHDLDQKNLHINEQIFRKIQSTLFFCGSFGHYPQTEMFPQISGSVSFYP